MTENFPVFILSQLRVEVFSRGSRHPVCVRLPEKVEMIVSKDLYKKLNNIILLQENIDSGTGLPETPR